MNSQLHDYVKKHYENGDYGNYHDGKYARIPLAMYKTIMNQDFKKEKQTDLIIFGSSR